MKDYSHYRLPLLHSQIVAQFCDGAASASVAGAAERDGQLENRGRRGRKGRRTHQVSSSSALLRILSFTGVFDAALTCHGNLSSVRVDLSRFTTSAAYRMGVQNFTPGGGFAPPRAPGAPPPKYQQPIVTTSIVLFMAYFFILREENDIDESLSLNRMLGNVADVLEEQEQEEAEKESTS